MQDLGPDTSDSVRQALQRILASAEFARAPRHSRFLAFIVEEALQGRAGDLKEYTIGIEVFEKPTSYDSRTDSTVRSEASKLRARLKNYYSGEGAHEPVQIQLPRGGYVPEFTGGVPAVSEVPVAAPETAHTPTAPNGIRWRFLVLCLVVVVPLAIVILWLRIIPRPVPNVTKLYALTAMSGSKRTPAWSPDGKRVVFSWEKDSGNYDLYITAADRSDAAAPRQLTRNPAQDWAPAWSPDGRTIAFVRDPYTFARVVLIPADGGTERLLDGISGLRLAWTPDSKGLLIQDNLPGDGPQVIWHLDIATGVKKQLTFPQSGETSAGHTNFALSASGDRFSFVSSWDGTILVQSTPVDRWSPSVLSESGPEFAGMAWAPDGKGLFVFGQRTGYLPAGGNQVLPIAGFDISGSHPAASRTTPAKLVFVNSPQTSDLWQISADGHETALISTAFDKAVPRFSRKGDRLAFITDRSGSRQLWVANGDGSSPRQITSLKACSPASVDWSADGTTLVFECEQGPSSWLYRIRGDGGEPIRLDAALSSPHRPAYSSDGRFIYFVAPAAGKMKIWKLAADGNGTPLPVHEGPAYEVRESRDGKFLYYTQDRKMMGLWRHSIFSEVRDSSLSDDAVSGWWDSDEGGVYWTVEDRGVLTFWHWEEKTGDRRALATAKGSRTPSRGGMTVGPNGRIGFVKSTRAAEDLMVAEFDRD